MGTFIQQIVNSLSVGSVIILVGLGVTIIFGLTGIVNFAHGEFVMVGGMVTWVLVSSGANFFVALLVGGVAVGALGLLLERTLFRFTLKRPMNGFIVSLGLVVLLQHIVIRALNTNQKSILDPMGDVVWQVASVRIVAMRLVVVVITAIVVAVTFFTIQRSRYGMALRASLADRETASLMGIPIRRYIAAVFAYGSFLAGLGGALLIALFPVTAFLGTTITVRAFAVALIGGLGNVTGCVVAGIILGLINGFSAGYGLPQWTDAYSFGLMIVILLVRPQGLLSGTEGPSVG